MRFSSGTSVRLAATIFKAESGERMSCATCLATVAIVDLVDSSIRFLSAISNLANSPKYEELKIFTSENFV